MRYPGHRIDPSSVTSVIKRAIVRDGHIPITIFLVAFILRLLHLRELVPTVFFTQPIFDEAFYDERALSIASGNWLGHRAFFMGPLYSYFVALLYAISHGSRYFALAVQASIGSLTCVLTYMVGRELFSAVVGVMAGLVACLYGVLIFYDGLLLMETLTLYLNMLCILLLVRGARSEKWYYYLTAGICLGLSSLGRASVLLFGLAVVVWELTRCSHINRRTVVHTVLFGTAVLVVIAPVAIRNIYVEGEFVLISANGGLNFYIGNGPGASGTFRVLKEGSLAPGEITGRFEAQRATGQFMTLGEVSQWWYYRTLSFIRQEPAVFMRNLLRKVKLFWNSYELPQLEWYDGTRIYSRVLKLPLATSGVVFPIAFLGLALSLGQIRRVRILHAYLISQTVGISLFFVTSRYRMTVLPVMCIFAAYGLTRLAKRPLRSNYPWILGCVGVFALCIWLTSPSCLSLNFDEIRRWHAINLALRHSRTEAGSTEAQALLKEVVAEYPDEAEPHFYYGTVLRRGAKCEEALREFKVARRLDPMNAMIPFQIGKIYSEAGHDSLAEGWYVAAVALAPLYKEAHERLGLIYANTGRHEDALTEFALAVRIDPTDSSLRVNLGTTYGELGMREEAIREFHRALHYDRANWKARYNLAAAAIEEGDWDAARKQLEAILEADPTNGAAREALLLLPN